MNIKKQIKEIDHYLKKNLSEKRYQHSIRVMQKAMKYAILYDQDLEQAQITALAHDIAKEMSEKDSKKYIIKHNLDQKLLLPENRYLIHGYIGADILERKYHFTKEMSDAVRYHTTARKKMTMLDKIIYLADKTEDGRVYPHIEKEREIAIENIDEAIILTLQNSIEHKVKKGKKINRFSIEALDYLQKNQISYKKK